MAIDVRQFIKKIHDDDVFYIENYLKIRTKDGNLVNFQFNDSQRKSVALINEFRQKKKPIRVIWLKARQLGISTLCEGEIFHDTANNPFKNSMIIAHEDKATQNLFSMSKLFYEELPPTLRPMKKYSNESALSFENPTNNDDEKYKNAGLRSKITVATAKNIDTGRSATIHNLHASEVAFWNDAETLMTGLLQCVPDSPNTMVFIESTANGVGGWFYDFWKKSEAGETDYIPIFLAWFDNPEYSKPFDSKNERQAFIENALIVSHDDKGNAIKTEEAFLHDAFNLTWEQLNWRKWCVANKCFGDIDKFHQEYPSTPDEAFIVSGRPCFNISSLKKYQVNIKKPINTCYLQEKDGCVNMNADAKGYISIWKMPVKDMFYVIGADVAEGLAKGDYSTGVLYDENFDLCASWHGHIEPDLFGNELVKLAKFYNNAYIGVEANNHGLTTLKAITRLEYWNIYFQKSYDKVAETVTQKLGWSTTPRTKPLMINKLAEYIRELWLGAYWDRFISECFTYVIGDDGSTNAQYGSNDDTVMATAIALQLLLEGRGENYTPEVPHDEGHNTMTREDIERNSVEELSGVLNEDEREEYSK